MYNSVNRTVEPSVEPVSVSDAKDHLRVTTSDDDAYIGALISTARDFTEKSTGRALLSQTWLATFDHLHNGSLYLPFPKLISVSQVQYKDADGNLQTWAGSNYEVGILSEPGAIRFINNPPNDSTFLDSIQVTYVCGYGASASDVPDNLLHAIKLLISHWYMNRSTVANARQFDPRQLPVAFEALTAPHTYRHYEPRT